MRANHMKTEWIFGVPSGPGVFSRCRTEILLVNRENTRWPISLPGPNFTSRASGSKSAISFDIRYSLVTVDISGRQFLVWPHWTKCIHYASWGSALRFLLDILIICPLQWSTAWRFGLTSADAFRNGVYKTTRTPTLRPQTAGNSPVDVHRPASANFLKGRRTNAYLKPRIERFIICQLWV